MSALAWATLAGFATQITGIVCLYWASRAPYPRQAENRCSIGVGLFLAGVLAVCAFTSVQVLS